MVRSAPLVLAQGRLEQREGATNILVNELRALDADERPRANAEEMLSPGPARAARLLRVAELRQVTPAGHNFG